MSAAKTIVEVTVIGKGAMSSWLYSTFLPDGITASAERDDMAALEKYAFFKGRNAESETAFVCRNFACSLPLKSQQELARQLGVRPA